MPAQPSKETQALDKLKAILLDQEKERISSLEVEISNLYHQLNDKEKLIESLDPIIADLLYKKILESKSQMAEALAPVMGGAIRKQITDAKDDIADALYPVIGKAVRKSVAEAMKNLLQAINERIDNLVTKSFRSGKKLDRDTLLLQSLPFHLQEIFLIHKKTGLLLSHASSKQDNNGNEDVISGMLSAIREFSKAAFSKGDQSLHEIQYEDLNIIVEEGKYAFLAFVVEGVPTINFKGVIKELENKIHLRFYKNLRAFDGDTDSFNQVNNLLTGFINSVHGPLFKEALDEEKRSKPKGILYLLFFILIVVSAIFLFPSNKNTDEQYQQIISAFQERKGSFFNAQRIDNTVYLKGAIFDSDREQLVEKLEMAGLTIESKYLFVLPTIENLNESLIRVQDEMNLQYPLSIIVDSAQIVLKGSVKSKEQSLLAATMFSDNTSLPLIINEISVEANDTVLSNDEISKRVIYFDPSSSQLTSESLATLDSVILLLNQLNYNKILISGYADSVGSFGLNKQIAQNRVLATKNYFIEKGFPIQKIEITSMVLEKDPTKFKSNRRVNFKVE